MSDIDVDALTREFFGQGMEPWRGQDWCEWAIDKDVAAAKERGLVAFVAARVEQDVRQQIAADLMECAAKADASRRTTFFESSQTRLAHMAETYRIAAQVARGGSDVG